MNKERVGNSFVVRMIQFMNCWMSEVMSDNRNSSTYKNEISHFIKFLGKISKNCLKMSRKCVNILLRSEKNQKRERYVSVVKHKDIQRRLCRPPVGQSETLISLLFILIVFKSTSSELDISITRRPGRSLLYFWQHFYIIWLLKTTHPITFLDSSN